MNGGSLASNGEDIRRLTDEGTYSPIEWSPDGSKILYRRLADVVKIFMMSSDGSSAHEVTSLENVINASWPPGGRQLALLQLRESEPYFDLLILYITPGRTRKFCEDCEARVDWSPFAFQY